MAGCEIRTRPAFSAADPQHVLSATHYDTAPPCGIRRRLPILIDRSWLVRIKIEDLSSTDLEYLRGFLDRIDHDIHTFPSGGCFQVVSAASRTACRRVPVLGRQRTARARCLPVMR
jgi:hypothetical protein